MPRLYYFRNLPLGALALLALAACSAEPSGSAGPVTSTPSAAYEGGGTLRTNTETASLGAAPSRARPAPPKAAEIIGWQGDDLHRVFGPAALIRRDLGAEVWQYQAGGCVLFAFLYRDGGVAKVKHLEARGGDAAGDPDRCIPNVAVN